jgi:hypothetical protein
MRDALFILLQEDGWIIHRRVGQRQDASEKSLFDVIAAFWDSALQLTRHCFCFQAFVRKVAAAAGPLPSDMLLNDADALIASGDLSAASDALKVHCLRILSYHAILMMVCVAEADGGSARYGALACAVIALHDNLTVDQVAEALAGLLKVALADKRVSSP